MGSEQSVSIHKRIESWSKIHGPGQRIRFDTAVWAEKMATFGRGEQTEGEHQITINFTGLQITINFARKVRNGVSEMTEAN